MTSLNNSLRRIRHLLRKAIPTPAFFPHRRLMKTNSRIWPYKSDLTKTTRIVSEARRQLTEFGKPAFPILLEYLGDRRYSWGGRWGLEFNYTVGETCILIIENNVELIGERISFEEKRGNDHRGHRAFKYFYYGGNY